MHTDKQTTEIVRCPTCKSDDVGRREDHPEKALTPGWFCGSCGWTVRDTYAAGYAARQAELVAALRPAATEEADRG